jgi:hypothetical protein
LIAAGANLGKVFILKCIRTDNKKRQFLLNEDLDAIASKIIEIGDVGLITLDPITAYMGTKIDSHKATEVRSQLGPLKDFTETTTVAFSAITHPPKNAGKRAIDHFIGSQAYIAAARIGHACFEEIEENTDTGERTPTGRILFTNPKNNPNEKMPTLAYRIVGGMAVGHDSNTGEVITASRVVWVGTVDITADGAIAEPGPRREDAQTEAKKFLRDILAGDPVPVKTIMEKGAELGFSEKQIRTAARRLNVHHDREGFGGPVTWNLPM